MLALGIPGEELTAMMLAAFLVHNVIPRPQLFIDRSEFVSGLYWTLLMMNVVIILFLLVATNWIAKAALINKRFLGTIILTLSLIGTYASSYNFSDIGIAMIFAVLGFILRSHKWPLTPILLGMVMGPISAIMVGAMVLLIGFTIRGALKGRKKREDWQINDS